ncbi:uncharacterized protein PAC_12090 [Phialocephala subalpina]|uniref:Uncharacterized protein n=1 Tax=Phialocephala subalpina TaxID=576137 RepID=A0A1L7XAY9_9HELO|nr:uncharacterized protein PAC_12090 [Phialocephala subalpina]
MVTALDKHSLAISRLCVPAHGVFAFALLLQVAIFVSYHDDHSDPRRDCILRILIICSTLSVLFDIVGVSVVGFNLFPTAEDQVRVGRWIVPLHYLLAAEELGVLMKGSIDGNSFRGIWAVVEFDGGGGVTIALVWLLLFDMGCIMLEVGMGMLEILGTLLKIGWQLWEGSLETGFEDRTIENQTTKGGAGGVNTRWREQFG